MELTQRESAILESVVSNFIETANPIGSRIIAKRMKLNLSPATIRNVLMDLEEKHLVHQPHTSAGRIPTDSGYRIFVDKLMKSVRLSSPEKKRIQENLKGINQSIEQILTRASKVLGEISKQLGVVLAPRFYQGIVENLQLLEISEKRILVVISIESGPVRTIIMDVKVTIDSKKLEETTRILNERLNGLTLKQIKESIDLRLQDVNEGDVGLIKLISESADELFNFDDQPEYHIGGTYHIVAQPEFSRLDRVTKTLELIEKKQNIIIQLLNAKARDSLSITIGGENQDRLMKDFSIITSTYQVGEVNGILAILGPTRMHYARMIALLEYMAKSMSNLLISSMVN
ncbi:heat-inducible transcription repressor HrcA [candidate division KSB1 bacterium]|nr:heat-inducible transcription repressor HrcA [candidate division KSB1 bacterium]